jgi:hypothetical protein
MPSSPRADLASVTRHLILPFAVSSDPQWPGAMQAMPADATRNLQALLRGMKRVQIDVQDAHTLSPPHERAWAASQGFAGLPDGLIPWAAQDAALHLPDAAGKTRAWAWVTPCHWAMGREHATLSDPAALNLGADESRALLAVMAPYFETDGIRLQGREPGRWLAEGEIFRSLPTASLDRVLGRDVDAWLPKAPAARSIKRLQNEMQMLLYTHAVNDTRLAARKLPVNSFWLSGTGALQAAPAAPSADTDMPRDLANAVFAGDWAGYQAAWAAIDSGPVARLLAHQQAGATVRLSLCGERGFETLESSPNSWREITANWLVFKHVLSPTPIWNGREQL